MPIYSSPGSASEGNVSGPDTSTINHVVLFADINGTSIKDGGPLGTASALDVGTESYNVAAGAHTHEISEVNGLSDALATIIDPFPDSVPISYVTGLQTELDGKADLGS